jgi:hypothetical protein
VGVINLTLRNTKLNQSWAVVGAANPQTAMSDSSDSSYVTPGAGAGYLQCDFQDITTQLPTLAQIRLAHLAVRAGGNGALLEIGWQVRLIDGTTRSQSIDLGRRPQAIDTVWYPWAAYAPDKTKWNIYGVNATEVVLLGESGTKVYEALLQVLYNEAPVTTITSPAGTIVDDATPTVAWTYHDPDGDLQERWQVKIFPATATTVSGFDPTTAKAWWDSANTWAKAPSSTSVMVPKAMPGGNWVVYVRTCDAGSNGRFGLWDSSAFTITGQPPGPPDCTVAVDPGNQRTAITVQAHDNLLNRTDGLSLNANGDVWTWTVEQGGTIAQSTVGGGDTTEAMVVTSNATTPFRAVSETGHSGQRVVVGQWYTGIAMFIKGATARTCRTGLRFYNSSGTLIGSTTYSADVTSTTSGVEAAAYAQAPTGAVTVAEVVEIVGMSNTETHKVHQTGINVGVFPHLVRGGLDSGNVLEPDSATFEHGVGTWSGIGCTLANPTDGDAVHGAKLLTMTATQTGQIAISTGNTTYKVTAGETYTFLASFKPAASGRQMQLRMYLYTANGWNGAAIGGSVATLATGSMTQLAFTAVIPDDVIAVQLRAYGQSITSGDVIKADAFSLHHGTGAVFKEGRGVDSWPQVEYSDDGGDTWALVRTLANVPFDPLTRTAVVYDYEAPPNTARLYRPRVSAYDSWLDANLVSDPGDPVSATLPNDKWLLKDPAACAPGLVISQRGDLEMDSQAQEQIIYAQGRKNAIVLSDVPGGESIPLSLTLEGDDYDTFEGMRLQNRTLLLQSDMTGQWYVRLTGGRKGTLLNTATRKDSPARIVDVTALEVERP